jgi:hypothetical protein
MDDSVVGTNASCAGIFRDHLGTFLMAFSCNLGINSVFNSEPLGYIYAMEYVALNGLRNIWFESDSTSALLSLKNDFLVPIFLQNR